MTSKSEVQFIYTPIKGLGALVISNRSFTYFYFLSFSSFKVSAGTCKLAQSCCVMWLKFFQLILQVLCIPFSHIDTCILFWLQLLRLLDKVWTVTYIQRVLWGQQLRVVTLAFTQAVHWNWNSCSVHRVGVNIHTKTLESVSVCYEDLNLCLFMINFPSIRFLQSSPILSEANGIIPT